MEQHRPLQLIIDCDPGVDDAVALALAAAFRDRIRLLAITTVAGNQTLARVTKNALDLSALLKLDAPVASGCADPLVREKAPAADIHGPTGLGDCRLPESGRRAVSDNAVLFLRDTILAMAPGEQVILVPTGPLTNIALLLRVFPEVKGRISQICLMGGGINGGNRTAAAEFNIWADPEAAHMVFAAGIPLTMCGLDATMQGGLTRPQVERLRRGGGKISGYFGQMLDFYFRSLNYRGRDLVAIHDATTLLYLLFPDLFTTARYPVSIDCGEGVTRGMTLADRRTFLPGDAPRFTVLTGVADPGRYQAILLEALEGLDRNL